MNPDLERAIREVLEAYDVPDSPEAFAAAIYQLRRIYKREASKPKPGRPKRPR